MVKSILIMLVLEKLELDEESLMLTAFRGAEGGLLVQDIYF